MLIESALNLIFMNSIFVEPYASDLDRAIEDFEIWVESCNSASQLKQIIELDKNMVIPVPLTVDVYEKYLELHPKDAKMLKKYSEYINLLIPDWKDYADKLKKKAIKLGEKY